jgi:hypothetical protein
VGFGVTTTRVEFIIALLASEEVICLCLSLVEIEEGKKTSKLLEEHSASVPEHAPHNSESISNIT